MASLAIIVLRVMHKQREHINPNTLLPPVMPVLLRVIWRPVHADIWSYGIMLCDIGIIMRRVCSATRIDTNLGSALIAYIEANIYMIIPLFKS